MVFEDGIEVIARGRKETTVTSFNKESVSVVLCSIFDGLFNKKEIIESLDWLENNLCYVKELMDNADLKKWYYQDMGGNYRIQYNKFILRLGLNDSDDLDTVVLGETERDRKPMAKDTTNDMKKVLGSYKKLMKEFNDARNKNSNGY